MLLHYGHSAARCGPYMSIYRDVTDRWLIQRGRSLFDFLTPRLHLLTDALQFAYNSLPFLSRYVGIRAIHSLSHDAAPEYRTTAIPTEWPFAGNAATRMATVNR